ncbi:indolethylamine N-methyltransferase-like [Lingula anatina]|uniref:Indolethylamine N-methyltransferase-like n=1 Tax=Lingula anatina TaxID=7574 RepID=A0A1S3J618_LINAN|nr:indolethylamine N-methyltransferase-like [Lingula anatina]|eukprot:XP_013405862.1 indolethylamine N-methyltransferase-like [Lingula anatina]
MAGPTGTLIEEETTDNGGSKKKLYSGEDYDGLFEPNAYLNTLYSDFVTGGPTASEITGALDYYHSLYSVGKIKGQRLLDVGTGPSIFNLISISKYFEEIYLSDFSAHNREVLEKWWKKEKISDWSWEWRERRPLGGAAR